LLLGIKEDEGWFLAWFGALVALGVFRSPGRRSASDARRKERTLGFAVVALALANGFAYYVVASHFGYTPEHPRYGIADSQWPQQLAFLLEMLVPFSFAPLRLGWRVLAALPFFAELFFTQDRTYPLYHIGAYYTVPLVVCAALATAYVAARVSSVARYALAGSILMAALFNNASVVHLGRRPFSPTRNTRSPVPGRRLSSLSTPLPRRRRVDGYVARCVRAARRLRCTGVASAAPRLARRSARRKCALDARSDGATVAVKTLALVPLWLALVAGFMLVAALALRLPRLRARFERIEASRIPALDGLRGVLAISVFVHPPT